MLLYELLNVLVIIFLLVLEIIIFSCLFLFVINIYVNSLLFKNETNIKEYIKGLKIEDRKIKFEDLNDITFMNFISYILFIVSITKFLLLSFGIDSNMVFLFILFSILGSIAPWHFYRNYIKKMKRTFYKYFDINTFEEK